MTNCKRCGKELKSSKSIKLGYGKTCYRIITLQEIKEPIENTEILDEVISTIKFLKCEINMMKIQMKSMKQNGIVNPIDPIERIKQGEHRPERDLNIGNMAGVLKEFQELVSGVSDIRQLLIPIETNRPNIYI